jgi:DNA-binding transcriptional LysR family regulator
VPELRQLRYFIAVAEELNFSRAARRLNMAQPPLSLAIRQLEQEIGASLFLRSSREVKLTEAGAAFLAGARRTLADADAAVADARRAAEGDVGSLRLGYSWSARFETLPALGHALKRCRPDVELLAEEMWNGRMSGALRARTIDVAVSLCPDVAGELAYVAIRSEPVVALLAASHPLATEAGITLDALADETFLFFPHELAPRLHDFFVGLCRSAGFEPRQDGDSFHTRWTIGSWDAENVALVPRSVSLDLPESVVAVPITAPADPFETQLVWRHDDNSPTVAAFVELATGVFAVGGVP